MRFQATTTSLFCAAGLTLLCSAIAANAQAQEHLVVQRTAYEEVRSKTILELQQFRATQEATDRENGVHLTWTSINPAVGAWFLLDVRTDPEAKPKSFHIENPDPARQTVSFDAGDNPAIEIRDGESVKRCRPWSSDAESLTAAQKVKLAYVALCDESLFLRNRVTGSRTNIEATTDFLREKVWGGESIVRFIRDKIFKDSQLENSKSVGTGGNSGATDGPPPMQGDEPADQQRVISTLLTLGITGTDPGHMTIGRWYPIADLEGVFASAFQPRAVDDEILNSPGAKRLDRVEAKATGYMIAFDLSAFEIGYAVGTDHPALGWSTRPPYSIRPRGLPGPDGISKAKPLVTLGMVNPIIASKTVATFTAGFKRQHGAFKFGDMATFNLGHHYGFIEKGVVFSKLQPGLSTLYGLTDGTIGMKTWTEADNALLPELRFARQNGVPLVETETTTGQAVPGDRVMKWGAGNWSGSAKAELRTLRAGACLVNHAGRSYLLYGYFSTATPSAMARVFQAYNCEYAMLLDMNALEHTYLALYVSRNDQIQVEHLLPGMATVDKKARDRSVIPRFIGFADNRDFFYITRKEVAR